MMRMWWEDSFIGLKTKSHVGTIGETFPMGPRKSMEFWGTFPK